MFNFFTTSLKLKGFPLDKAIKKLHDIKAITRTEFADWQEHARWNIFNHHALNNDFYKQLIGGRNIKNWEDVPILHKSDYQRPLFQLLSKGYDLKKVYKNNTSGSSGHPFFFAKDKDCHALTWAIIRDRYKRHNIEFGDKQARFYGIPLTKKGFLKEKIKDFLSNRVRFPVFDMSDIVLERFLEKFRRTPFVYAYGYTSAITLFAKFLLRKGVVLKAVCPTLQAGVVTSEVCTPEDRAVIEKAFGVNVVNEYGASELDFIAFEDQDGDWITTDESLYIEILDDNNKPLPPESEVLFL